MNSKIKFKSEAEFAKLVVDWLESQEWEVFKEVSFRHGDIDIIAIREGIVWAIECKLQFSTKLLTQAATRRYYAHYVSVASPVSNCNDEVKNFYIKEHGLGVIGMYSKSGIHNLIKPTLFRTKSNELLSKTELKKALKGVKGIKGSLHPEHKNMIAGGSGGQLTPYKITIIRIREYLKEVGEASLSDIIKNVPHHYKSNSAKQQLRKALTEWEVGFRVRYEDKKYYFKLG